MSSSYDDKFKDYELFLFLRLKIWDLLSSSFYVSSNNWYNVAERNELKAGEIVQIWFFRSREGKPCFAVVNLGQKPDSCSSAVGKDVCEPRSDVYTA
ncbi:hypothetical protein TIFTF001_012943 [Ficus carica]|uniref:TF-B3 domain-containing protein n=1 Tax=Ficus carica TaxID=3494 RepID=A0AA88D6R8_FICCA|nr:hypothetical protein TIFTF001_012943 [Ficus carica]